MVKDERGRHGVWKRTVIVDGKEVTTRAGSYWNNMSERCRHGGRSQKFARYFGCYHEFINFQDFAEWCQFQTGYGNDGWQLDKDLLSVGGKKVYSKETCVFVPIEINNIFGKGSNSIRKRQDLPMGVYAKMYGKFGATICKNGKTFFLGSFSSIELAQSAYINAKEEYVKLVAEKYKDSVDTRVYEKLINYKVNQS